MRTCATADARQTAAPEPASDAGSSGQAGEARGVGAPAPAGGGCAARALAADAAVLKLCAFGPSIRAHHSQPWRQDGGSLCYNRARPACLQSTGEAKGRYLRLQGMPACMCVRSPKTRGLCSMRGKMEIPLRLGRPHLQCKLSGVSAVYVPAGYLHVRYSLLAVHMQPRRP